MEGWVPAAWGFALPSSLPSSRASQQLPTHNSPPPPSTPRPQPPRPLYSVPPPARPKAWRACVLPRPCPAFHVSLPSFSLRSASSIATIGQKTSSDWPINGALSPPCYWVEQNKNKQSERGQRRSEAAADAEVRGRGRLTRDLGEQQQRRRRRPEGSVAAARLARSGGLRPLPQPLSSEAAARWRGERAGGAVEAAAESGSRWRGRRPPPPRSSAGPAASAPTPWAEENRPRCPPAPGRECGAAGPPPLGPPPGLAGRAGLSPARRPTFHFPLGVGVGRRVSGPTEILWGRFAPSPPSWSPWWPALKMRPGVPRPGPPEPGPGRPPASSTTRGSAWPGVCRSPGLRGGEAGRAAAGGAAGRRPRARRPGPARTSRRLRLGIGSLV